MLEFRCDSVILHMTFDMSTVNPGVTIGLK